LHGCGGEGQVCVGVAGSPRAIWSATVYSSAAVPLTLTSQLRLRLPQQRALGLPGRFSNATPLPALPVLLQRPHRRLGIAGAGAICIHRRPARARVQHRLRQRIILRLRLLLEARGSRRRGRSWNSGRGRRPISVRDPRRVLWKRLNVDVLLRLGVVLHGQANRV